MSDSSTLISDAPSRSLSYRFHMFARTFLYVQLRTVQNTFQLCSSSHTCEHFLRATHMSTTVSNSELSLRTSDDKGTHQPSC